VSFKILKLLPCAASIAIESRVFQSSARGFPFIHKTIEIYNIKYTKLYVTPNFQFNV